MNYRNILLRYQLHQVLFWIIFAAAWFYFRYTDYGSVSTAVRVTAVKTVDLALIVSFANYILVPRLLYKNRYGWFSAAFGGLIILSSIFKLYIIGGILHADLFGSLRDIRARIYDNIIPHFFLVTAGVAFRLTADHFVIRQRLADVSREKAETELSFLKSQINPHFLFNSLNSVYFLIDKRNTAARDALHKFSEMLRFRLYEIGAEKIPVEKEIQYLQDYITMQQLRKDENCLITVCIDPSVKGFLLEPLILVPFVENSFKHLSNYEGGKVNEIRLDLGKNGAEMAFAISNTTEGGQPPEPVAGGIGLANVRRRLELLYPDRYRLRITNEEGWFSVNLKIKIV